MLFYFEKIIYNYYGDNMKKIVVILICLIILCSCGKKTTPVKKDCPEFKGGEYKVIYHSNGGTEYSDVRMCETCERPEVDLLPQPTKKDYIFGGWYYDELFLSKADVKTTDELESLIYRDERGCDLKYRDINLYALWIKK